MTSYIEKDGRMVAQHLPPNFGQNLTLSQHRDLAEWAARQHDKFQTCGVCNVPIRVAEFEKHVNSVHTHPKDNSRARALRR